MLQHSRRAFISRPHQQPKVAASPLERCSDTITTFDFACFISTPQRLHLREVAASLVPLEIRNRNTPLGILAFMTPISLQYVSPTHQNFPRNGAPRQSDHYARTVLNTDASLSSHPLWTIGGRYVPCVQLPRTASELAGQSRHS